MSKKYPRKPLPVPTTVLKITPRGSSLRHFGTTEDAIEHLRRDIDPIGTAIERFREDDPMSAFVTDEDLYQALGNPGNDHDD